QFSGLAAIALLKESGIDLPLIIVSGAIGEETAADCLRCGARDWVRKSNLSRLVPAIERELQEVESRSKRKRAEEELSESRRLLVDMERITKAGGWEYNVATDRVKWTDEVYRIHGVLPSAYDPNNVHNDISFYAPEDRSIIETAFRDAVEQGKPYDLELRFINATGERLWVRTIGHPEYQGDHVVRVHGNFMDITERRKAEEALRTSEWFLKSTLDGLAYHIAVLDDRGEIILTNKAYCDFAERNGIEPRAVSEGINYLTACDTASGEHSQEAGPFAEGIREVLSGKHRYFELEYPCHSPDEKRWFCGRVTPIIGEGPRRVVVAHENITERKHAEEALRLSEENFRRSLTESPLGVRIVTIGGNTIYANLAILDIYGYVSIEELETTPAEKRYTPESFAGHEIRKEKRKRGDDVPSEYEISIVRKNGEVRHLQVLRKEILWDGEKQFQVIYHDLTEHKQAEEKVKASRLQLRALYKRLQKIREEERLLVAREIHDLMGGGLTGLKMDLSWLLRKLRDTDPHEVRDACQDKIASANALIDQMISEVRRISTALRPSILDDLGLIAALEWQLAEFTNRTAIPHEFTTTFEYIALDEHTAVAVFRIFQEALTNVVRHARATKVTVDLREGEKSLFTADSFVLEISDNGRGITREELLNRDSLGLLGMKERVLAFGGDISIYGEPGGGTSLVLKIPRRPGEAA
ncbi:MAG: hypothetical protein CVU43_19910, partial [Chloroflexi bacterium HGW-Chloroflexi-5]